MRPEGMTGSVYPAMCICCSLLTTLWPTWKNVFYRRGRKLKATLFFRLWRGRIRFIRRRKRSWRVFGGYRRQHFEIVIFSQGTVRDACAIPIAGDDIRNDIAHMHHVSLEAAERAKCQIGVADGDGFIDLGDASGIGDNKVGRSVVCDTSFIALMKFWKECSNELIILPGMKRTFRRDWCWSETAHFCPV